MAADSPRFISFKDAGRELGVSRQVISRLVEEGRLSCLAVPGHRPKVETASLSDLTRAHTRAARLVGDAALIRLIETNPPVVGQRPA